MIFLYLTSKRTTIFYRRTVTRCDHQYISNSTTSVNLQTADVVFKTVKKMMLLKMMLLKVMQLHSIVYVVIALTQSYAVHVVPIRKQNLFLLGFC